MALPSKRDPEPVDRQAETDPFLEFEPERPSLFSTPLSSPLPGSAPPVPSVPQPVAPPAVSLQIRHRSGVGAAVAVILIVALGGAGVAIASVRGEQIGQAWSALVQRVKTRAVISPATPSLVLSPASPSDSGSATPVRAVPATPAGAAKTSPAAPTGAVQSALDAADPVTSVTVAPIAPPVPPTAGARPAPSPVSIPVSPVVPAPGIVAFRSPLDLEVYHQGQLVGTTGGGGLTLPAGVLDLVLVSARHEFRQARTVTVTSGQSTAVTVALPNGRLSVNADPWAEVLIDNRLVGTTPLANLPVRIGSHEVVWRHPTLGERRQVVIVKARTTARIGVDFRR